MEKEELSQRIVCTYKRLQVWLLHLSSHLYFPQPSVHELIVFNKSRLPSTTAIKLTIPTFLALIAVAVALSQGFLPPDPFLSCGPCFQACEHLAKMKGYEYDEGTSIRNNCPPLVRYPIVTTLTTARGFA